MVVFEGEKKVVACPYNYNALIIRNFDFLFTGECRSPVYLYVILMFTKVKQIKSILGIRNDRFGEFLLNIPAFRALKEVYLESRLTLAVNPAVKELAECVEYADEVVVWGDAFRKGLRKRKFDLCVIFNPTKEAHWMSFWAGIPKRVGYNRKWGILLTHKMPDKKSLGLKHEVEYNLDLVGLVGAKTKDRSISLARLPVYLNPEYAGAVAIHPFTSDSVKRWPFERFIELANKITLEMKAKVVLVGKTEDRGQSPKGTVPEGIIDLINKTSLVELAQILKQCKLLVSCDSGPMHLAAAVGTRVLALFRNDLPGKTAKRWGPWGDRNIVIERSNLLDITVEEIFDKTKGILK